MRQPGNYIPFEEIISRLRVLCNNNSTGTVFVTTQTNRSVQIRLNDGEIVFLYFSGKLGNKALELMVNMGAGRFRFQKCSNTERTMGLPPSSEILQLLEPKQQADHEQPQETQGAQGVEITEVQRTMLEEALAVYLGPMAKVVCEEHLESTSSIENAVKNIAAEIPSEQQAKVFLTAISKMYRLL